MALLVCLVCLVSVVLAASPCIARAEGPSSETDDIELYGDVPLSGLRFIGTHNSYHQRPRLFGLPFLPISFSAKHRYEHPSLAEQLDGVEGSAGAVRQLEIDVHMRRFDDELRVFHVPWIDNQSSCKTLQDCLRQVMAWSDARQGVHAPILIWLEPKDETPIDRWLSLGYYERIDLMRVEEAILEVVPRERLVMPDDVRRGEPTLPAALARYGWPTLADLQGKVMFALLDEDEHRARYLATHPDRNLTGRVMFAKSTEPTEPWAAMFKVNNAVPTVRDMQAFGREALADPELAALQVYPEPPKAESALAQWWKNLWQPIGADSDVEDDAASTSTSNEADDEASDRPGNATKLEQTSALDRHGEGNLASQGGESADAEATKDLRSKSKPPTREVDRRLRRELETVYADTRAEERARHLQAVAELEERLRLEDMPESEALAIVLENARRSKTYRDLLRERLHVFIDEHRKADILGLVRDGFLVTTTADEPNQSAAKNRERTASTLMSAAQFVSTDALLPRKSDGYALEFPGPPIRCNVLVDPDGCEEATRSEP